MVLRPVLLLLQQRKTEYRALALRRGLVDILQRNGGTLIRYKIDDSSGPFFAGTPKTTAQAAEQQ